jgi:dienelactone hydrolase
MKYILLLILLIPTLGHSFCAATPEAVSPQLISIQKTEQNKNQHWTITALDSAGEFQIQLSVYQPRNDRGHNLILFPTIEGESLLERQTAAYFARKGYLVMIPTIEEYKVSFGAQTACAMDLTYRRVQGSAILMAEIMNEIRPAKNLMIAGASQGGIRSIMAAAVLPQAQAVWAIVAGGDFPSIYANSEVQAITSFRQQHMRAMNFSNTQEYEEYLRENLKLDPEFSCWKIEANIAMVIATRDDSVPTDNQERLVESCQPQLVRRLNAGHVRGAMDLYLKRITIRKFFESK